MDAETREWLEAFEERIKDRMDARFEHLEGWLRSSVEEMRREIAGSRAEMNHGFNMLNRTLDGHERRLITLENNRPMAAE